ncbi:MAG: TIM barrel protein [Bryobacterales bacterium]|nr:TIM barrel protein [Bryobacteraceae bacterium]MDW8355939.1 TIM barrel protein [Bryobacterales bacterium]
MTRRTFLAASAAAAASTAPRSRMGIATTCFMTARRPKDTLEFLEYCHGLGAGGIQAPLTSVEAAYIARLRRRLEELGMYFEAMVSLPREDATAFERTAGAAKEAGALVLRTTAPGPRRYEAFESREAWEAAAARARAGIKAAVPVVEKLRLPLAIENHRDWTLEEFLLLLKEYSSEFVGVCLDTGNNIALLDDPMEVVERLAPYAVSTHIKDMGVEEYEEGFYLVEVPLGEGALDVPRMVETIRRARPDVKWTLEMITRDPTPVPCLSPRYWTAMPRRDARDLARTLVWVRRQQQKLPRPARLGAAPLLRLEEDNVKQCLHYARERLGI